MHKNIKLCKTYICECKINVCMLLLSFKKFCTINIEKKIEMKTI